MEAWEDGVEELRRCCIVVWSTMGYQSEVLEDDCGGIIRTGNRYLKKGVKKWLLVWKFLLEAR